MKTNYIILKEEVVLKSEETRKLFSYFHTYLFVHSTKMYFWLISLSIHIIQEARLSVLWNSHFIIFFNKTSETANFKNFDFIQ